MVQFHLIDEFPADKVLAALEVGIAEIDADRILTGPFNPDPWFQNGYGPTNLRAEQYGVASGGQIVANVPDGRKLVRIGGGTNDVAANMWFTAVDIVTDEDIYIILHSLEYAETLKRLTESKFSVSGKQLPVFSIEEFRILEEPRLYLNKPLLVGNEQPFQWELRAARQTIEPAVVNVAAAEIFEEVGVDGIVLEEHQEAIKLVPTPESTTVVS